MKITSQNARTTSDGKAFNPNHNSRDFDLNKAKHIDQNRLVQNLYYRLVKLEGIDKDQMSFQDYEKEFYKRAFSKMLEARNERYRSYGHSERCRTIDDLYSSPKTCPEEHIIQIGNKDNHVSEKAFKGCVIAYCNEFNKRYGQNCKLLDVAIHFDEATPHAHIRRVWVNQGKDGLDISQNKALKELGFERPDPDKPSGRYNNAKMPFTSEDRQLFADICQSRGIPIVLEQSSSKKGHIEKNDYILQKQAQEMALNEAEITRQHKTMADIKKAKEEALSEPGVAEKLERAQKDLRYENMQRLMEHPKIKEVVEQVQQEARQQNRDRPGRAQ